MSNFSSTNNSYAQTATNETGCPEICDKWMCWPTTPPGSNVTMNCPKGTLENGKAYKYCEVTGIWETKNSTNGTYYYTHYDNCIMPQIKELAVMCNQFGTCPQIARITRCIEMVGLSFSFISIVISLYIFFSYRVLKNNRTKIHKNLFIATLLQVLFRLIKYIDQSLDPSHAFLQQFYLNEICTALLEYAKTTMFMWMFIEGLYLHNMITVTVFQEYSYVKIYCYIGWLVPGLMTLVWLIVMLVRATEATWKYYYFLSYYWILEGPRSTVIIVNLLFLLNIIRVLIVKLRESRTSEIQQVRKAVRAAIFLLPLMGISHMLFFYYKFNEAWKFALWSFSAYFLGTFQGFFVAVLYCFLNGEVQSAIRNSFYLHMSLRNHDYTPCRNFTLISIAADDRSVQNFHETGHRRDTTVITDLTMDGMQQPLRSTSKTVVEETDTSLIGTKNMSSCGEK